MGDYIENHLLFLLDPEGTQGVDSSFVLEPIVIPEEDVVEIIRDSEEKGLNENGSDDHEVAKTAKASLVLLKLKTKHNSKGRLRSSAGKRPAASAADSGTPTAKKGGVKGERKHRTEFAKLKNGQRSARESTLFPHDRARQASQTL